ncbi:DNA-binding response regulator [Devosia sp. DBB001]|nr:DNA-binding response regulator [Devosia sp. DBB001]
MSTPDLSDNKRLILVVEDEQRLRANVVEELIEAGYAVLDAEDGIEALERLDTATPDLILCDITMPRMGGYELLRALRKRGGHVANIPFVFLTALSDRVAVIEGRGAGADDYLTKPVDFDLMLITIKSRLDQVERIRQASNAEAETRRSQELAQAFEGNLEDLAAALSRLSAGVLLFDGSGQCLFRNPQAEAIIGNGLSLANGRLHVANATAASALRRALATAIDEGTNPDIVTVARDGEHPLIIQFISLGHGKAATRVRAAAFIIDPNAPPPLSEKLVTLLFGLTPTEARVAAAIGRGHSLECITEDMGITNTTFAFHLRNIFRKTQVARQQELVALLARSALLVQDERH